MEGPEGEKKQKRVGSEDKKPEGLAVGENWLVPSADDSEAWGGLCAEMN